MDTWTTVTALWLAELRAAGASQGTIDLRAYHLKRWAAASSDPWEATRADLVAFMAGIGGMPEYRRSIRSSLRSFYGWAHLEQLRADDPAARLPKIRVPMAEPRPADDGVVRDVIARAERRELLMILLMAEAGLRRKETASVHADDVEPGDMLRVTGKGGKTRTVPLTTHLARSLRAEGPGWVFPNGHGSHLTSAHVGVLLRRLLPAGTTPHQLRHGAATALVDVGLPLTDVREFLGHASLSTTQRYVFIRKDRMAAAARRAARRFDAA